MHTTAPMWIGIDVSSATLDICLGSTGDVFQITNDTAAIQALVQRLQTQPVAGIICEATGFYHELLTIALWDARLPLTIVNPAWIKAFRGTTGKLAKTDRADARLLADYGAWHQPTPSRVVPEVERELKAVISAREDLVATRIAHTNRLRGTTVPAVQHSLNNCITQLETEIAYLDEQIRITIASCSSLGERYRLVQTMPGVGPVVGAILVAHMPELGLLNRREVAALGGLAPIARDSGTMRGKRFVQGGRAPVRRAMYLAAQRCGPNLALTSRKDRLRAKGKPAKVVNIAVARWMLTILNVMIRDGVAWDDLEQAHRSVEVTTE